MDQKTTSASEMQKNALENIEKAKEILAVVPTTLDNLKEAKKFLDDAIEIIEGSRKVEQSTEPVEDDDAGYDEEIMSLADTMGSPKVEPPAEPPKLVAKIVDKKKEQGSKLSDAKTEQPPAESPKLVAKIVDKNRKVKTSPKTGAVLFDDPPPSGDESDS
jgi:hypothetical protein